jgi:hypothetical protein
VGPSLNFVFFSIFSSRRLRISVQQLKPCLLQIGLENLNWVGKSIRKNTKNREISPISERIYLQSRMAQEILSDLAIVLESKILQKIDI